MLGERVGKYIITACKKAKYFSITFDTTSDAGHVEQMSQIIRFVEIKRNSVDTKEGFIDFILSEVKRAEGITAVSYTHLDVYKRQRPYCRRAT